MSRTVKEYLADIDEYTFLPGLQREFVWSPDQIAALFDSLIRDYPIGILTEWEVRSNDVDNFNSYHFLRNYIHVKGQPPDEVENAGFSRYNTPINNSQTPDVLIIDGQQRLNSLYIGVCGCIAEYEGGSGYPRDDVSNWDQKQLCIDLFGHPDFKSDDVRGEYEFQFRRIAEFGKSAETGYERTHDTHHLWMPVGDLWNHGADQLVNQNEMRNIVSGHVEDAEIPVDDSTRSELRDIALAAGHDLYGQVLKTDLKNKSIDHNTSEIPEIFQRLNVEGEEPKPYQLLMSRLMSYWPYANKNSLRINPREQVETWVDDFCQEFPEYEREISRSLFMRYSSYLIKRDLLESDIKRLSENDMDNLREKWVGGAPSTTASQFEWFRSSLEKAFSTIIDIGIRPRILKKTHIFAVLGQFYYYNSNVEVNEEHRNTVFRFLAQCLLLNESYRVLTFGNARGWMRYLHDQQGEYDEFPGSELLAHENLNPSREDIRLVVENARYTGEPGQRVFTSQNVAAILGLLDEAYTSNPTRDIGDYSVDHIFPQAKTAEVNQAVGHDVDLNRLGNLQLLYHPKNQDKDDTWPDDWFDDISDPEEAEIKDANQYPDVPLDAASAEEFIDRREEKLVDYLEAKYV